MVLKVKVDFSTFAMVDRGPTESDVEVSLPLLLGCGALYRSRSTYNSM